jgi:eukaryotic-like serine/threonine-protein kinase
VRDPYFYVSGLLELEHADEGMPRRSLWRQSMTALARAAQEIGPAPLDGLEPNAVARGVRVALNAGLVDDLDWMAAPAAGLALYTLASAMPPGAEQRELGRRLLTRLHSGNAETFAAVAAKMALSTPKSLFTGPFRARLALVMDLPIGAEAGEGPLAYAILARKELAREWIERGSSGSLPMRRLAARIVERGAREAVRRKSAGDLHAMRVFLSEPIKSAWRRLLIDRESLVWRHAAIAEGLLAPSLEGKMETLLAALGSEHGPTEWRRVATAIAALGAVDPDAALQGFSQVMALQARDAGVGAAAIWGLPRAAETEPDVAESMFYRVLEYAPLSLVDAVCDARLEYGSQGFGNRIAVYYTQIVERLGRDALIAAERDPVLQLAVNEALQDLEGREESNTARREVERALVSFAQRGAPHALEEARRALEFSETACATLEGLVPSDEAFLATATALVRDLDIALFERNTLVELLRLGTNASEQHMRDAELDGLRERLAEWLTRGEPDESPTLSSRKLRALLHVADSDLGEGEDSTRNQKQRARWARVARNLIVRAERSRRESLRPRVLIENSDPDRASKKLLVPQPRVSRRALLATVARCFDALIRIDALDETDVFLILAFELADPDDFRVIAEASMDPELEGMLDAYARFLSASRGDVQIVTRRDSLLPSMPPPAASPQVARASAGIAALRELETSLVDGSTDRADALRAVIGRLAGALSNITSAHALRQLVPTDGVLADPLQSLDRSLGALAQMLASARARLGLQAETQAWSQAESEPLSGLVRRMLGNDEMDRGTCERMLADALAQLSPRLPSGLRFLISDVTLRIASLDRTEVRILAAPPKRLSGELPLWVPPRRTLGAFYLLRPLGEGGAGSVFLVTRIEERHDPTAEKFALKVPDYSETASRSLSEDEFLKLFREEGSALLSLPNHPNLARFVTFDLGVKPKPILVMEFVEGITLERELESRSLTVGRAMAILEGVAKGMAAMHGAAIGHFDIKPGNVVLRREGEAVLVDFGLSGRRFRPGCATGPYGAPEIWADERAGDRVAPFAADIYAFGCLAFELLSGRLLFDAPTEVAMIARHLSHDGAPPQIAGWVNDPALGPLGELLFSTLRRAPEARINIEDLQLALQKVGRRYMGLPWPLRTRKEA